VAKIKLILGFAVVVAAVIAGSQIIPPELANFELQDDLHDIAALNGSRVGLLPASTEESLRASVISRAREHDIQLTPEQVTVESASEAGAPTVFLAAEYSVPVNLLGYSFELYFRPTSTSKSF
jgi:hypothetical protein